MRICILVLFSTLIQTLGYASESDSNRRIGFALNSSFNSEFYTFRIIPGVSYTVGNNQLDFGVGFNPANRQDQKLLSTDFSYKYYPNGTRTKYAMYMVSQVSYVNRQRESFYPSTYNYVFVNGGYGFDIHPFAGAYLGTSVSCGLFTYQKNSKVPHAAFQQRKMFDVTGSNLAFQFYLGYRF